MMQRQEVPEIKEIDFTMVGGNTFGRYDKISRAETFNFIVSDGWFVPYAGYKKVLSLSANGVGRDIYSSSNGDIMVEVIGNQVFSTSPNITKSFIGTIATSNTDVFIAENNLNQIIITDTVNMYVYNYSTGGFFTILGTALGFNPGYITFQDSRFIVAALGTDNWRLSVLTPIVDSNSFPNDAQHVGALETKPDHVVAAIRFPGRGNLLFVFGSTVTEPWNDAGNALFPYIRLDSFNMDYGLLSANTLAENENIVVGLFANEQSGPAIMYSTGSDIKKISTDGIDFLLSTLTAPQNSFGFLFRQDGHQIYQITFKTDNLSLIYDFNTGLFFTVTDENLNYHIAKRVVFFNNNYYFVSFNDGNLYQISTQFTNFHYSDTNIKEIPRIRICSPDRLPNSQPFIARSLSFIIENGQPNQIRKIVQFIEPFIGSPLTTQNGLRITTQDGRPICLETNFNRIEVEEASEAVDLSISRDGAVTFGSSWRQNMNPNGIRKSKFQYQRLGWVNDATYQFKFTGFGRFVVGNGMMEIYQ